MNDLFKKMFIEAPLPEAVSRWSIAEVFTGLSSHIPDLITGKSVFIFVSVKNNSVLFTIYQKRSVSDKQFLGLFVFFQLPARHEHCEAFALP